MSASPPPVGVGFGESLCSPFVSELDVSGASISVSGLRDRQSTVCASGPLAARLDTLQFELGEGPGWEVRATRSIVLCPDLSRSTDSSWPVFLGAARELGIESLFSFPMLIGAALVGVVDLHCISARVPDPEFVRRATSMAARVASVAVQRALHSAEDHRSHESAMAPALRREVHQATGMIISQLGVSATEAFARLQGHAFTTGTTIHGIAHDVVTGNLVFTDVAE